MSASGVDLVEVARCHGTPAYVYDLARVRAAHHDLRAMLPADSVLHYSVKANPHPRIIEELRAAHAWAEVASTGELDAALDAGMPPENILLTAPGKTGTMLDEAIRRGVRRFSVDSPTDLARLDTIAAGYGAVPDCLLRVNADQPVPGLGLTMTGVASQFGVDASWVERDPAAFRDRPHARVTGLHLYMGTNIFDEDTLVRQYQVAAELAARLARLLGPVTEVNLGGGFGCPYARAGTRPRWPALRRRLEQLLDAHLPQWRTPTLRISFESGRYLSGDCGTLLTEVLDVKVSKGQRFVVLDAGINHLGGMSGMRRLPPLMPEVVPIGADANTGEPGAGPATVVGPLCTPLDTFARGVELPHLTAGRFAAVPNVGAYGLTASLLAFLGHPAPAEVICDGTQVREVTRLQIRRQPEN